MTAIILAAQLDHMAVVEFLEMNGESIHIADKVFFILLLIVKTANMELNFGVFLLQNGMTPIMWAVRNNHLNMVKYLEKKGADLKAVDKVCL